MSDSTKQNYSKGATTIQKMGYASIGPIGASGEGIWNPIAVLDSPKFGGRPVFGVSYEIEDDSSRKDIKHYTCSSEGHPNPNIMFFKSSNLVEVDPTGIDTSMGEPCAKKKKVMTNTMKAISMFTSPMYAPVASGQNPKK